MYYLYAIIGPTDKIYFGITTNPKDRWRGHRKCNKNHPLYNAMRKHGRDKFSFHVLSEHEHEADVRQAEMDAVLSVGTMDRTIGYNLTPGGDYDGLGGAMAMRVKLKEDRVFREAYSLRSMRTVTETWAARSDERKREIFDKISNTLKAKNRNDPEFYEKQRRGMLAARAKGDVRQRAAAASKGIKKWWDELRSDPERYNDYIQRRKATLQATNRSKRA